MRKKLPVILLMLLVFAMSVSAEGWENQFKGKVAYAAVQMAPQGLRDLLPADGETIDLAVRKAVLLYQEGQRDPAEHYAAVLAILRSGEREKVRLLSELIALTFYYVDKSAPRGPRAFFLEVERSRAIANARFDGYHRVEQYPAYIKLLRDTARPVAARIQTEVAGGAAMQNQEVVAEQMASLFNLYANAAVDVWCTLAQEAGIALGVGRPVDYPAEPPAEEFGMGIYTPAAQADIGALNRTFLEQAARERLVTDLAVPAEETAPAGGADTGQPPTPGTDPAGNSGPDNGEELIFDEGLTVTGDQAQQGAQQLQQSHINVDTSHMGNVEELDERTRTALQNLGIDINSPRPPFQGIRGGVQQGQTIHLGDVEYNVGRLSTVEIGSREERTVYMQLSENAMGVGAGSGHLNQKAVARVIQSNVGGFKTCFERRLREVPDLAGRVFIQFTITATGEVSQVEIVENTTGDLAFAQCLIKQIQRLRFPPPTGGEVSFIFPFIFEQSF